MSGGRSMPVREEDGKRESLEAEGIASTETKDLETMTLWLQYVLTRD